MVSSSMDGNCLFHSVLAQMPRSDYTSHDLRKQLVYFMTSFPEKVFKEEAFWSIAGESPGISVKDYLKVLLQNGQWPGEIELLALSLMWDCGIAVLQVHRETGKCTVLKYRTTKKPKDCDIVLVYNGVDHYNGTVCLENRRWLQCRFPEGKRVCEIRGKRGKQLDESMLQMREKVSKICGGVNGLSRMTEQSLENAQVQEQEIPSVQVVEKRW